MKILVLSTWFPYPLSTGAKIRAYHLIGALARELDVALVSFADERVEPGWLEHMRGICQRVEVVKRSPFARSRVRSLLGWFSPLPSALYAGYSREMEQRARQVTADWKPDLVLSLTVITASYAARLDGVPKVLDIDNVLSRYLREEYQAASGILRRVRAWAAWQKFRAYERRIFRRFDLCLTVSAADRARVHGDFGIPLDRLGVVSNGVDIPDACERYDPLPGSLVFNGSLAYAPNRDAMQYFLAEIFPTIRREYTQARLRITGRLDGTVTDWVPQDGAVELTGYLDDVRPVVGQSWACVVPLRAGAGTRLKILEAMALGTPVITTSKGAEGLEADAGTHLLIADTPGQFAEETLRVLTDPALRDRLSGKARYLVAECYDWERIGQGLRELIKNKFITKNGVA